jgi:multicomponent K+:H+ antiporter subunit E
MRRLLPFPILSAILFVVWLVIAADYGAAHIALAALLAISIPLVTRRATDRGERVASWGAALRLVLVVLWDIVVANAVVARRVLGRIERLRPGFVIVPVDTEHAHVMTLFAAIITMTPGTVSCELDAQNRTILVHALDLDDPERAVADMKARYERPLKEIFGC